MKIFKCKTHAIKVTLKYESFLKYVENIWISKSYMYLGDISILIFFYHFGRPISKFTNTLLSPQLLSFKKNVFGNQILRLKSFFFKFCCVFYSEILQFFIFIFAFSLYSYFIFQ